MRPNAVLEPSNAKSVGDGYESKIYLFTSDYMMTNAKPVLNPGIVGISIVLGQGVIILLDFVRSVLGHCIRRCMTLGTGDCNPDWRGSF